jgi:hypothetical protein
VLSRRPDLVRAVYGTTAHRSITPVEVARGLVPTVAAAR